MQDFVINIQLKGFSWSGLKRGRWGAWERMWGFWGKMGAWPFASAKAARKVLLNSSMLFPSLLYLSFGPQTKKN